MGLTAFEVGFSALRGAGAATRPAAAGGDDARGDVGRPARVTRLPFASAAESITTRAWMRPVTSGFTATRTLVTPSAGRQVVGADGRPVTGRLRTKPDAAAHGRDADDLGCARRRQHPPVEGGDRRRAG